MFCKCFRIKQCFYENKSPLYFTILSLSIFLFFGGDPSLPIVAHMNAKKQKFSIFIMRYKNNNILNLKINYYFSFYSSGSSWFELTYLNRKIYKIIF